MNTSELDLVYTEFCYDYEVLEKSKTVFGDFSDYEKTYSNIW